MGAGRLAVMLMTFFGLVIFFIFVAARSNTPGMTLLYGNLSTADATEIAAKLDTSKIAYKLSDDGTQVTVQQKEVGKARILLAQDGLPHQGSVGYEIFDQKQAFGTTSFVQNINQLRALEGELSRTVGTIDGVRSARIHLVLPTRELFSKDSSPASASVFLNLHDNTGMSPGQIQAIQHLVAAAVPHLKASNIAIIDQSGNLLARGEDENQDITSASSGEEMKQKYERRVSRSIEDMIGRIVGYGKVRATVTAEMNFDVVNRNSESYNPEGQVVRSTQTTSENNVDNSSSTGNANAVTVQNNLPGLPGGATPAAATPTSKNDRNEEVTNYEISKTVENLQRASGQIQKLSIAVLVDGRYVTDDKAEKPKDKDAAKDWVAPRKYTPRDQAELDKITSLVKSSVGFDESRGDSVQVVNIQFTEEPEVAGKALKDDSQIMGFQKADLLNVAETLTLSIVAVLIILLVLRPLAMHVVQSAGRLPAGGMSSAEETAAMLPPGARAPQLTGPSGGMSETGELETMIDMSQVEGKVKASSVQKISELVQNHPAETVAVIRSWMSQES
jgi:flagellar M-ring protein FliF